MDGLSGSVTEPAEQRSAAGCSMPAGLVASSTHCGHKAHGLLTSLLDQDLVATGVLSLAAARVDAERERARGRGTWSRPEVSGPGPPVHEMFGGKSPGRRGAKRAPPLSAAQPASSWDACPLARMEHCGDEARGEESRQQSCQYLLRCRVTDWTHLVEELCDVVDLAVDEEPDVVAGLVLLEVLEGDDLGGSGGDVGHFD